MTEHSFSLIPFPDSNIPDIKIAGRLARQHNVLAVTYSLAGNTADILFPAKLAHPMRKHELWHGTCFEIFLAIPCQPHYWEFNFSPSGDWNAYFIEAYRRVGFREESLIECLQNEPRTDSDCFLLECTIDLNPIIDSQTTIQVGITSVIKMKNGYESYWALAHPKPQADFHVRESFTLVLEGSAPP